MDGGTLQPYSMVSPKDNRERKIFLAGRASSSMVGHLLCLKEEAPVMGIYTVAWAVAMAWPAGQDFEGKAWQIGDREVWSRGVWTDTIEWSQG